MFFNKLGTYHFMFVCIMFGLTLHLKKNYCKYSKIKWFLIMILTTVTGTAERLLCYLLDGQMTRVRIPCWYCKIFKNSLAVRENLRFSQLIPFFITNPEYYLHLLFLSNLSGIMTKLRSFLRHMQFSVNTLCLFYSAGWKDWSVVTRRWIEFVLDGKGGGGVALAPGILMQCQQSRVRAGARRRKLRMNRSWIFCSLLIFTTSRRYVWLCSIFLKKLKTVFNLNFVGNSLLILIFKIF